MKRSIGIVALALIAVFAATSFAQGDPSIGETPQGTATPSSPPPCTPFKAIYAEKNWRERNPMRGETPCLTGSRREKASVENVKQHFFEYRKYREIATMKCLPGREGWFVPNPGSCSVLSCESGLSWGAKNPDSGAEWVYQLLDGHTYPTDGFVHKLRGQTVDGGPDPSTFLGRLMNHEIASTLGRSAWSC